MLTDTFTVRTFFDDFTSDPTRAMRWGALRHDSGDPFEFIKMAKEAWTQVEDKAGIKRESGKVAEGKMAVFSDSLDIEKALQIQAMCDEQGMAGESRVVQTKSLPVNATDSHRSFIRYRHFPDERFSEEVGPIENLHTTEHRHQAEQDRRQGMCQAVRRHRQSELRFKMGRFRTTD